MILTSCSDVSLRVFAYHIFGLPEDDEGTLARSSWEDAGSDKTDVSRARSSGVEIWMDEASYDVISYYYDQKRKDNMTKYN